jgi:hypothetical protein
MRNSLHCRQREPYSWPQSLRRCSCLHSCMLFLPVSGSRNTRLDSLTRWLLTRMDGQISQLNLKLAENQVLELNLRRTVWRRAASVAFELYAVLAPEIL